MLTDEGGLIADTSGQLTAFETSGRILWQSPCGNVRGMPVTSEALVAVTTDQPAGLAGLDRPSGKVLWNQPLPTPAPVAPLVRKHRRLPLKAGEAVLSGCLSPMERTVFKAGLARGTPLIWVKPWGLQDGIDTAIIRRALEDGHLLILSAFDDAIEVPSARRAVWCNPVRAGALRSHGYRTSQPRGDAGVCSVGGGSRIGDNVPGSEEGPSMN